jgi:hypothetical protein
MAVREVWENGVLVESVDIPDPEPDPITEVADALPVATLEEANDLLAQIVALIGGN